MALRICVFGSSSARTKDTYLEEAETLGRIISEGGHVNINGAGRFGCMGACNAGSMSVEGSIVEGVIHQMWMPDGTKDELQAGMTTLRVADGDTLTERKKMLCEASDCFLILPGGPGTYDELWEVISEYQLGLPKGKCPRPVCLVNVDGYWDPTLMQLQRCFDDGMLYKEVADVVHDEPDAASALKYIVEKVRETREKYAAESQDQQTLVTDVNLSDESRKKKSTL
jgi:uncharacterized protein (TIGR00730 family)